MIQNPMQLLLTPKQAAAALEISPRKLWSLTNEGEIPHLKIGRLVRYSVADLTTWIERQKLSGAKNKSSNSDSTRRYGS